MFITVAFIVICLLLLLLFAHMFIRKKQKKKTCRERTKKSFKGSCIKYIRGNNGGF